MPTILNHPKIMFLNSSSNQFNVSTFQQYNNPTLISLTNNYLLFPTLFPWSTWNKGTRFPGGSARHMVNILKITQLVTDHLHSTWNPSHMA
jgi:hypothetical protein